MTSMSDRPEGLSSQDPVRICLRGLRDASERLREVEGTPDEQGTAVAITEAAMWICSLDELWWDVSGYAEARESDGEGQLVPGVRWARNRGLHEVLAVHETTEGRSYPKRFPMRFWTVRWRTDVGEGRRPDPLKRAVYDERLRGKQVWVTLASVERFLVRTASAGEEQLGP